MGNAFLFEDFENYIYLDKIRSYPKVTTYISIPFLDFIDYKYFCLPRVLYTWKEVLFRSRDSSLDNYRTVIIDRLDEMLAKEASKSYQYNTLNFHIL